MKNRDYKNFAPDNYYHTYNRGNEKESIFREDSDYVLWMARLKENLFPKPPSEDGLRRPSSEGERKPLAPNSFSLTTYCLMPNHFHLLIRQCTELPISKLLSKVSTGYSKCFNLKYERIGHLFQDKFKAKLVDKNDYLLWLSAYIHANPVVAGLAKHPANWQWSSYNEYIAILDSKAAGGRLCETNIITDQFGSGTEYEQFVLESIEIIREKKEIESFLLD
ncbi:MAG: transposase [Patescibacteria group bacterium]|nr:transposase [Patescibacteria group bacterium]